MNNPKFSIIMANFNKGKYVGTAIKSVIDQTYANWELVIVDDASTDNSLEIIKEFKDERIKLFANDKNLGCGSAKKRCADLSRGEIIGILDSDDYLKSDAIERIVSIYNNNFNYGCVYSTHYLCDESLNVKNIANRIISKKVLNINLEENNISHFLTFTREAYDKTSGFDKELKIAEDKDLVYKLEEITEMFFLDEPLYFYRINAQGISSYGSNSYVAQIWEAMAKFNAYKRRVDIDFTNLTKKELSAQMIEASMLCVKFGRFKDIFPLLKEGFLLYPVNLQLYLLLIFRLLKFVPFRVLLMIKSRKFKKNYEQN